MKNFLGCALQCFAIILLTYGRNAEAEPPVIFWASDPVMPGEAAVFIGHALSAAQVGIKCRSLHCAVSPAETLDPVQGGETSIKAAVPLTPLPAIYDVTISTSDGTARTRLNAPTIYWMQGDMGIQATPRGWIRLFGRAITLSGVARLHLTSPTTKAIVEAKRSSLWDATFYLSGIAKGVYTVTLEDESGVLNHAGEIKIVDERPTPKRFDVKTFGAKGNGIANDSEAIAAAVAAAGVNSGQVYFPSGRYRLTSPIELPPGVDLAGESRELVNVFWPDVAAPPPYLIHGTHRFRISDLTLYASNYKHFITNDVVGQTFGDIEIARVRIHGNPYRGQQRPTDVDARLKSQLILSSGGGDLIRLRGNALRIFDSELDAGGRSFALLSPKDAYVARNTIYNGRWGWYTISGPDGVIVEDNTIRGGDLMSTGGGVNTLNGASSAQNVFFGNNRFERMHGWDREAITTDGGFGIFYGHIASSGTTIKLLKTIEGSGTQRTPWEGSGLFILGGRGMGQVARIVRSLGNEQLEIDAPFQVKPDGDSLVTVVPLQRNFIFYRNSFVDTGVGIQYYGTSMNHVMAENTSTRTAGFFNTGRWYRHYQPSWYCQFFGNSILEGNFYRGGSNNATESGEGVIGTYGFQRPPNTSPLVLGAIHRRNEIANIGSHEIRGSNSSANAVKDVIVEVLADQAKKVRVGEGVADILVRIVPKR